MKENSLPSRAVKRADTELILILLYLYLFVSSNTNMNTNLARTLNILSTVDKSNKNSGWIQILLIMTIFFKKKNNTNCQ